jgi:transposase
MFRLFDRSRCPRCRGNDIYRVQRKGPISKILSAIVIYPYECNNFYCQKRFYKFGRKSSFRQPRKKIAVVTPQYAGINVSKNTLDVYIRPFGKTLKAANTEIEVARLVEELKSYNLNAIVVEGTEGLEKEIVIQLQAAFLPVAIIDRRQGIYFAKAMGKPPKTRAINAEILAHFGEVVKPEVLTIEPELARNLGELLGRRRQLMEMQNAEKNLLSSVSSRTLEEIKEHISYLDKHLERVNREIDILFQPCKQYLERFNLIKLTNNRHRRHSIDRVDDRPEVS